MLHEHSLTSLLSQMTIQRCLDVACATSPSTVRPRYVTDFNVTPDVALVSKLNSAVS